MAAWPRATQRVLLAAAALLLALSLLLARRGSQPPLATPLPDDPRIELRLDLNAAGMAELEALPGIGPALAARIVAHRQEHGPFGSVEALEAVPGVGRKLVAQLRPLVVCGAPR